MERARWILSSAFISFSYIMDMANWIGVRAVYLSGPFLVLFYLSLFGFAWSVSVFILLPILCPTWSFLYVVHLLAIAWIGFMCLFSFFTCLWVGPGYVSDHYKPPYTENMDEETAMPRHKFCKRCMYPKPARAHHCKICGRCSLKADHHCPWIMGCVGFKNHKYFIQWLVYNLLGCGHNSISIVLHFVFEKSFSDSPILVRVPLLLLFLLSLSFSVALTLFDGWHVFLILTGQTTREFHINSDMRKYCKSVGEAYENPYDIGVRNNFRIVFGEDARWWSVLVPSFSPPMGNGINWKNRRDYLMNDYFESKKQ